MSNYNRKNGLAREKTKSRSINHHFRDEKIRGGNTGESRYFMTESLDRKIVGLFDFFR